ncbi:MAG: hypothetical protein JW772_04935 [Candidatus Diapherotrites archaeon]|nr:hypothetical protein [Candidatus Diapherotrites archaeon]
MGQHIVSRMSKPEGTRKNIVLMFDESEDVLEGLKKAMQEHALKECTIVDMNGSLKQIVMEPARGKRTLFKDTPAIAASGQYKLSFGDLYGHMKITTKEKNPVTGKFIAGKAGADLEMKISFVEK